jgi:hypothetical protein
MGGEIRRKVAVRGATFMQVGETAPAKAVARAGIRSSETAGTSTNAVATFGRIVRQVCSFLVGIFAALMRKGLCTERDFMK